MVVQLAAIEKGKQPDLPLQSGDILYVPFSWMRNMAVNASSIAASTSGAAVYAIH
jgi:polysaccharide export outer membrane protein